MGMAVLDVNFSEEVPSEVPAKKEGPSLLETVTSKQRSFGRNTTVIFLFFFLNFILLLRKVLTNQNGIKYLRGV